jgi:hypothetical protein
MSRSLLSILFSLIFLVACQPTAPVSPTPAPQTHGLTPTPTMAPQGTATVQEAPPEDCPSLTSDTLRELRDIEAQVSQLRGIQPLQVIDRLTLPQDELRQRSLDALEGSFLSAPSEERAYLLFLLDLIPEQLDLPQLYQELVSEQLVGAYDRDENLILLPCEGSLDAVHRLAYVQQFTHALLDQHFLGSEALERDEAVCARDPQACLAINALIEGDASLVQEQWLRTFASDVDLEHLQDFFATYSLPVFDAAPGFIKAQISFPYLEGLFFVRSLYLEGGWAAVDQAYLQPPQTTEQILHPARYPRDLPVRLTAPDLARLDELGWSPIYQDTLGEWPLLIMLASLLPEQEAITGAEGWGGDLILLLENPVLNQRALILVVQWDSMRDAFEFTTAYKDYGLQRFGEALSDSSTSAAWETDTLNAIFVRQSNQTLLLLAESPTNLATIREAMLLPLRPQP